MNHFQNVLSMHHHHPFPVHKYVRYFYKIMFKFPSIMFVNKQVFIIYNSFKQDF